MASEWSDFSSWYDFAKPGEAYTQMITRWGAMSAAYSKAMASLFEMAAKYQEEATRDMARMGKDPMAAMDVYWAALGRKMEMWNELYPIMERMQRDADLMYERLRREADAGGEPEGGEAGGPASGSKGFVRPGMRYGSAAAESAQAQGSSAAPAGGARSGYGAAMGGPSHGVESGADVRGSSGYRRVTKVKP